MTQIIQVAGILLATLGTGAATMTVMKDDVADFAVPENNWSLGSELDGRTFDIVAAETGSDDVLTDSLVFRDGTFQSVNCQTYCDFGWTAYQTEVIGDVVHFTATTRCPDAPHTVVWYGTVTGDALTIAGTWTTRRWYWTHQIAFEGGGTTSATLPAARVSLPAASAG